MECVGVTGEMFGEIQKDLSSRNKTTQRGEREILPAAEGFYQKRSSNGGLQDGIH